MTIGWRSGPWSNAEKNTVNEMWADGKDIYEIGEHLNRKPKSVGDLLRYIHNSATRAYAKKLDDFGELLPTGRLPARYNDDEALIKASVQTVEALIADGFEPGHGELNIPAGDNIRLVRPQRTGSIGSPAGMCAEMGGYINVGRQF
jgi:hypothetical protein